MGSPMQTASTNPSIPLVHSSPSATESTMPEKSLAGLTTEMSLRDSSTTQGCSLRSLRPELLRRSVQGSIIRGRSWEYGGIRRLTVLQQFRRNDSWGRVREHRYQTLHRAGASNHLKRQSLRSR